ncbi:MAG: glycosyltransferase family 2 protein [Caldilineaceae bacterium]
MILPATNESILLQRTVDQFAATLPDNSEIIVVDNGSTDSCADFLLDHSCPHIHLIRTPELLGVAGARNRGLAQSARRDRRLCRCPYRSAGTLVATRSSARSTNPTSAS